MPTPILLDQEVPSLSSVSMRQRNGQAEYASGYWPGLRNKILTLHLGSMQPRKPNHSLCSNWPQIDLVNNCQIFYLIFFSHPASSSGSTRESSICTDQITGHSPLLLSPPPASYAGDLQSAHLQLPSLSRRNCLLPLTLCQGQVMEAGCLAPWQTE